MWPVVLLLLATPADCGRLAHPDFDTREAAHERLRAAGVLAVPALLAAARGSDEPESRFRAGHLLGFWRDFAYAARARAVLFSPWPVDPEKFYGDQMLRWHVRRVAKAEGVDAKAEEEWAAQFAGMPPFVWPPPPPLTDGLVPDAVVNPWNRGETKWETAAAALGECRRLLGVERAGWPFR